MADSPAPHRATFRLHWTYRLPFAGIVGLAVWSLPQLENGWLQLGFGLLAVVVILELVRGRVDVDTDAGYVEVVRSWGHHRVAVADVCWIRVPAWGPAGLFLREGVRGNCWWRFGELVTSLQVDKKRMEDIRMLAEMLGVQVGSPWTSQRWAPDGQEARSDIHGYRPTEVSRHR